MVKRSLKKRAWLAAIAAVVVSLFAFTLAGCGEQAAEKYKIAFVNYDGTTLYSAEVEKDAAVAYVGETPAREATAEYSYTFAGWSVDGETVLDGLPEATADATYKAVFNAEKRKYSVKFMSEDGETVLYTAENVAYGASASYSGTTPTKAETAEFKYAFAGWTTENGGANPAATVTVNGDTTVYASFAATRRTYAVIFKSEDGKTTLGSATVAYGDEFTEPAEKPTKPATAEHSYTFAGWTTEANGAGETVTDKTVTESRVLYAKFTASVNEYFLTFVNYDGTELFRTAKTAYGTTVTLADAYDGRTPVRPSDAQYDYEFKGWADENGAPLTTVTIEGETTVYADYTRTATTCTVRFMSEDGSTELFVKSGVAFGTTVAYEGETPVKTGSGRYAFVGWTTEANGAGETLTEIVANGNMTVYAKFAEYNLKITYVKASGETVADTRYELTTGEYNFVSPVLRDYVADVMAVSGTTGEYREVAVTYTAIADLTFDVYDKTSSTAFEGSGTEEDPYLIASSANFKYLAEQVNGGNDYSGKVFRLTANLDLNGTAFTVGAAATATTDYNIKNAFAGTFDGNGKVIKGRNGSGAFSAYFAAVTGTVKNLTVMGTVTGNGRLGGLAVIVKGTVENCVSYVDITGAVVELGGIASVNWGGTIKNCVNYGSVTGTGTGNTVYNYGGIVGFNYAGGAVNDCVNYGAVSSKKLRTGGVVGANQDATVTNCVNYGAVSATGTDLGGIVGENKNGTVSKCVNRGTVTNTSARRTGGIVGYNVNSGKILSCDNRGTVTGAGVVGGIIGNNEHSDVTTEVVGCKNYADVVTTAATAGGIAGFAKGKIENCVNYGRVSGAGDIGGIAGSVQNVNGAVVNCVNEGSVDGGEENSVGGIAGDVQQSGTVTGCTNKGAITGTDYIGGIVGNVIETAGAVASNVNEGTVTGTGEHVGEISGSDVQA